MLARSLRTGSRRPRGAAALAAFALVAVAAPGAARAGSFAPDGTFVFDPQAVATFDFEEALPSGAGSGAQAKTDGGALSGGGVLVLSQYGQLALPTKLPAEPRTYRMSLWARGGEAVGGLEIAYHDAARADDFAALYPTGRVTSDGWVEVANDAIPVDGARAVDVSVSVFAPAGAAIDAIEIVPDGVLDAPPGARNAACAGATDAGACRTGQVCMWGECRDAAPWVPPIPADRDDVSAYLAARLRMLFGPYLERAVDMPAVEVALEQMQLAEDRWSYWNGFTLAVRRLHDGHTTTSGIGEYVLKNPKPLAVCFLEGDADLSHAVAPKDPGYLDVLVSHTGADHNLGLKPGDRLVAVDGQHPIAWARSLVSVSWTQPGISNHMTFAELASTLRASISRYAGTIDVVRCDPALGTCGPVETIALADVPLDPPGTPVDDVACDNRPLRHVPGAPANHATGETIYRGLVAGTAPEEHIYGMEWETLFTQGNDAIGAELQAAVDSWRADARGVVMDHRTGNGGTNLGPQILWGFSVPSHPSDYYQDRQAREDEQPTMTQGKAVFAGATAAGLAEIAGSNDPVTSVPVALLLTQDVSASDWLPMGMKGAPNVKLFAPFQTNGGFSTRYSFGYWLGVSYVVAVGDTFMPDGRTHNGRGVDPDVVVLPKQSDLLAGKDTVFEAALAWVREGLAP
jgi:hypothetical protein